MRFQQPAAFARSQTAPRRGASRLPIRHSAAHASASPHFGRPSSDILESFSPSLSFVFKPFGHMARDFSGDAVDFSAAFRASMPPVTAVASLKAAEHGIDYAMPPVYRHFGAAMNTPQTKPTIRSGRHCRHWHDSPLSLLGPRWRVASDDAYVMPSRTASARR